MIKHPNSRQKRKFKCGFKGIGSHKQFGIGRLTGANEIGSYESQYGSYTNEVYRKTLADKAYANLVHAAIKHNTSYKVDANGNIMYNSRSSKHIGSKRLNIIKRLANFE